jgi:hypothetical protein
MREEKELIGQIVLQRNLELTKEKELREGRDKDGWKKGFG